MEKDGYFLTPTRRAQGETAKLLRDHGLRATAQRRVIWEAFVCGRGGHLSAVDVCRRAQRVIPELARGTVYKCLGELAQAGLLRCIDVGKARLYDANLEPHEHFRCRECTACAANIAGGPDVMSLEQT